MRKPNMNRIVALLRKLSPIGHGGDHGELLSCAAHGHRDRGLACGREASATHIGVDQRRLVTPVKLCALMSGAFSNARVFPFKPRLNRRRTLFISAPDRLLRGETPARQVFADAANLQFDAVLVFDQLADRGTAPEEELHLELFRALVDEGAANRFFLHRAQASAIASHATPGARSNGFPPHSGYFCPSPKIVKSASGNI